jgi:voltage-gated potassium channel
LPKKRFYCFFFITLILIYLSGVGIYYFEHEAQPEQFSSIFDSLWWAIITLTTVGYGDVYPITTGGRLFTFFILMIGLGVVAIPTGILSSALTRSIDVKDDLKSN